MSTLRVLPEKCADEPIRLPGSVQQHGFFLLTESNFRTVLVASENTERFLGLSLDAILGRPLEGLLSPELLQALQDFRLAPETDRSGLVTYLGSFRLHRELFSVTTHRLHGQRALEFELEQRMVGPEMMNSVATNFVGTLSRIGNEEEICEALARQIAELTGFDRVLLYSFDEDDHGTVLAELNNGRLPSYLGLRFPASDIPRQARELYVLNTVRIIPDANYRPSPLLGVPGMPGAGAQEARDLDLSLSVLRSVSPVHLEYMRNMGTLSSMSVSIVVEGRLWGLIGGHHREPKGVPYLVRSACDMLSKMAATQLNSFATAARLKQAVHFHGVQRHVLTVLAAEQNFVQGLIHQLSSLCEVTNASGVSLLEDGHTYSHGEAPAPVYLERLAEWLDGRPEQDVFVSSRLAADLAAGELYGGTALKANGIADASGQKVCWAEDIHSLPSGMIAVRIGAVPRRYLLWFRPEIVTTVRWAGEPAKAIQDDGQLRPRHSFEEWKEVVRGQSRRWSSVEVESAQDFRAALTMIGLRRAEEAVELGEARFQQLTHALPAKVFTAANHGELTYVNDRWSDEGQSAEGLWFEHADILPEDVERCAALWEEAVRTGKPFETELRLRSPDGGPEKWNLVRVAPFQRAGAERAGWVGTFVDLTESKERETALRMTEKLALTGRMTSVIAHEINNPLEAITNLMYLLRTEMPDEGPAGSYIGMVESELERISGITKQTLRWNRETSDQSQRFAAGLIIDDVLRLFAGKSRNRHVTIRVEGDRDLPILGVLGQIRQVLANLISNAIDASPIGGLVVVSILQQGAEHCFTVRDGGRGIGPAARARLFQPFYSTKGDLGNGLGLYISHEIVERHGGRIDVDSVEGRGTSMSVWLPAGQPGCR